MNDGSIEARNNLVTRAGVEAPTLGYGDYLRFSKLLLERCGLYFSENRRSELEYRIRLAFASTTCANLDEFYNLLQDPKASAVEMDLLINAITISETHFFRDAAQFNALYTQVLPRLIERKRSLRTLRIWSAGCASGEEPYSIAILLRELLPDIDSWSITILGTDINTSSIDRAHTAAYGNWAFREERALQLRGRYFRENVNRFELVPEVSNMVTFNKLNLVQPLYPSYDNNTMSMDMILCRNVTIYFSEAVTRWVVDRFYDSLVEGGWLVVGHSEPSIDIYRRFRVRNFPDAILYQRMPETSSLRWPYTSPLPLPPVHIPPPPAVTQKVTSTPTLVPLPREGAESLIPAGKNSSNEDSIDQAKELLEYGRLEDALSMLLRLSREQPGDAAVCALLGQAYADLGIWQEAETWCRKAFVYDRLALDAYYTLALVLQHEGKLDQAIDAMKKVVYIERDYILGHYGLANLYHDSGLMPQAQKSLDNTLRLLSGHPVDRMITGSRGITAGRLQEAVIRQQQSWGMI